MKSTITLLGEEYELVKPFHACMRYSSRFYENGIDLDDMITKIVSNDSVAELLLFEVKIGHDAIIWDEGNSAILVVTMDSRSMIVRTVMETSRRYVYVGEDTICIHVDCLGAEARIYRISETGLFRRSTRKEERTNQNDEDYKD